jgi:hypothetical protein
MPTRKDLGAALLEEHAVRADALERARREHERSGRPLWAVLLDAGLLSEEGLFLILRRRSGAQVLGEDRLSSARVPAALRPALPSELAGELGVLPLSIEHIPEGRRVTLAMVDPLAEVPRLRAALARLGVVEVHRLLLHRALLRRYLVSAYLDPPAEVPLSDQPTGIITLPEHRPRGDERTERLPGRDRPLLSPPVQTSISRNAITQPLNQVALGSPSVQVDPQLVAEIEELSRAPEPHRSSAHPASAHPASPPSQRSGVHPAQAMASSAVSTGRADAPTQVSRILRPDAPTEPARPLLAPDPGPPPNADAGGDPGRKDQTQLEWPLPEARPRAQRSNQARGRPTAPLTSLRPSALSPTVPTPSPALPPATLAPILMQAVRSLADELEARLPQGPPSPRAATLARVAERAASALGLREHAEIGLLALLYAIERRLLTEGSAPPEPLPDTLGWAQILPGGLGLCLRDLQAALYGDPPDGDMEGDPRPARDVVRCAAAALDLSFAGVPDAALPARLAETGAHPRDVLDAVLKAMRRPEAAHEPGADPADPDRTDELSLPSGPPDRPELDGAADPSEPEIEIEVAEGDEAGLEIMQTKER